MDYRLPYRPLVKGTILALALTSALALGAHAQAQKQTEKKAPKTYENVTTQDVAGQYQCTYATVAGKAVPCSVAPLSLKADGHFEVQGREGQYLVDGQWVELSGTVLRSRAKIETGHKIVFRFYNKKGLCEVIYERRVAELGTTKLS